MTKVKANFVNQIVYVGLDFHKRKWNIAIYLGDLFPWYYLQTKGWCMKCQKVHLLLSKENKRFSIQTI